MYHDRDGCGLTSKASMASGSHPCNLVLMSIPLSYPLLSFPNFGVVIE